MIPIDEAGGMTKNERPTAKKGRPTGRVAVSLIIVSMGKTWQQLVTTSRMTTKMDWGGSAANAGDATV